MILLSVGYREMLKEILTANQKRYSLQIECNSSYPASSLVVEIHWMRSHRSQGADGGLAGGEMPSDWFS